MARIKYYNARLIDGTMDQIGVLYTDGGSIAYVGSTDPELPCDEQVDLRGKALLPAFIDLHCHLRDPGYTKKETLETGMRAALKGGYATLCAMANTLPVTATPEQVQANHFRAEDLKLCRLYQAAAAGENLKDEVPTDWEALSKVTPMITNDGNTIFSDDFMEKLLVASKEHGFIVSTHCQPERAIVKRDIALLARVGGNLHVGHVSHRESLAAIRKARAEGLDITFEITPHHLIGYDSDYRVNPPIRSREDNLALIASIKDGFADCLATDHAPHTPEDKANGMAGISNIEYAMGVYLWVFHEHDIPLTRFSEMASQNPAKRLGIETGLLREGYPADLVVVDLDCEDVIDPDKMISRSHNTPFAGRPTRGRVLTTIVGGEVRYDYGSTLC